MSGNTSEFVEKPQTYYDELRKSTIPWFEVIKKPGNMLLLKEIMIYDRESPILIWNHIY